VTPRPASHHHPSLVEYPGPIWVQIPAWPEAMIEPTNSELGRWAALWRLPQAKVWSRHGQERAVASLVRLEQRCYRATRPSARCAAELRFLRRELGLMTLL
jgi:hypothetical protein